MLQKINCAAWVVVAACLLCGAGKPIPKPVERIRVKELIIVDDKNQDHIVFSVKDDVSRISFHAHSSNGIEIISTSQYSGLMLFGKDSDGNKMLETMIAASPAETGVGMFKKRKQIWSKTLDADKIVERENEHQKALPVK